jgi:hypothetical protein
MGKNKERLSGKPYEDLIFKIYMELEPFATIKKNDKIKGIESGIEREIDISVRKKIADHEILMIIQAKDHKKRADIKIVGEFDSVIRDVRASRGILICNAGFTKTAKEYAKNRAIDLYTAHDASAKDWQGEIKIPVVRTHLTLKHSFVTPVNITQEYKDKMKGAGQKIQIKVSHTEGLVMKKPDGTETTFLQEFSKLWRENKISKTPGKHTLKFSPQMDVYIRMGDLDHQPTELEYTVTVRHYYKLFTPTGYRGVKNYFTEKFKPTFIQLEGAVPFFEDKTWQYIEDPSKLAIDAVHLEVDVLDIDNMRFITAEMKE